MRSPWHQSGSPALYHSVLSYFLHHHLVVSSHLGQAHVYIFVTGGGEIFADVIGANRQFAMATIDQRSQLNSSRSPEGADCVQRGASGAAGEKNIIHDNDGAMFEGQRKF